VNREFKEKTQGAVNRPLPHPIGMILSANGQSVVAVYWITRL
jgi:hypothetical protein